MHTYWDRIIILLFLFTAYTITCFNDINMSICKSKCIYVYVAAGNEVKDNMCAAFFFVFRDSLQSIFDNTNADHPKRTLVN